MSEPVDIDLQEWGECFGRLLVHDGYSSVSITERPQHGRRPYRCSVLMRSLPPRVWPIHDKIMNLSTEEFTALVAYYCIPKRDKNGATISRRRLAITLGCSMREFERRRTRAIRTLQKWCSHES